MPTPILFDAPSALLTGGSIFATKVNRKYSKSLREAISFLLMQPIQQATENYVTQVSQIIFKKRSPSVLKNIVLESKTLDSKSLGNFSSPPRSLITYKSHKTLYCRLISRSLTILIDCVIKKRLLTFRLNR